MGAGLQVITGRATNPSTTLTAVTVNTGDSLTVRSTNMGADIELIQAWGQNATGGVLRVRSPRMHDQVQNIRLQVPVSLAVPLMPWGASQMLYSQDPITMEITGGGAETDLAALLVYYNDIPGISARLHSWAEIKPLIQNLTTVELDLTSGGTAGQYGGAAALNSSFDTLIRNVDYAVLGYYCGTAGGVFGLSGVDTGNLRLGGPLTTQAGLTDAWFVALSQAYGKPMIPVINSANVAGITCDLACTQTATAFNVGINLAQLKSPLAGHTQ